MGFQCVQLVVSDFLPTLPKEHMPKTLDVVALFAQQDAMLNVSLTAVTMLWNVTDQVWHGEGLGGRRGRMRVSRRRGRGVAMLNVSLTAAKVLWNVTH